MEENVYGCFRNGGTPKSSILIGFSIINHPFWGTPIFGNTRIYPGSQPDYQKNSKPQFWMIYINSLPQKNSLWGKPSNFSMVFGLPWYT